MQNRPVTVHFSYLDRSNYTGRLSRKTGTATFVSGDSNNPKGAFREIAHAVALGVLVRLPELNNSHFWQRPFNVHSGTTPSSAERAIAEEFSIGITNKQIPHTLEEASLFISRVADALVSSIRNNKARQTEDAFRYDVGDAVRTVVRSQSKPVPGGQPRNNPAHVGMTTATIARLPYTRMGTAG